MRKVLFFFLVLASLSTLYAQGLKPIPLTKDDKAKIEAYQKIYEQSLDNKAYRNASGALNNIAYLYWERNQFQEAINYYERSIKENEKVGNRVGIGKIQNNLGMLYADLENYQKSVEYFQKALDIRKEQGDRPAQIDPLINQAVSYQKLPGQERKAIQSTQEAVQIATSINDLDRMRLGYGMLSEIYKKIGEQDSAIRYFELYRTFYNQSQERALTDLKTKADEAALKAQIAELQRQKQQIEIAIQQQKLKEQQRQIAKSDSTSKALYDNLSRSELLIKLLEEEQKTTAEQAARAEEKQRFQTILFLIALGVAVAVAFFLFWINRNKTRHNKALSAKNEEILQQKEEIRAQAESLDQSNKKLIQLDQFKEQMTHMIVHDLKNPLNTIINNTAKATDRPIKSVHQSGLQMLNLVSNMLDAQRYTDTAMKAKKDKVDLFLLFRTALEQTEVLRHNKNIEIDHNLNQGLFFLGDGELTTRVLVNLLTNAIKFSPNKGLITVKNQIVDGKLKLAIRDQGPGIPKEFQQQLFMPYTQAQQVDAGLTPSTGLGLTFCKKALEAQSGTIELTTGLKKGTEFQISLPATPNSGQTQKDSSKTPEPTLKREPILLDKEEKMSIADKLTALRELEVYEASKITAVLESIKGTGQLNAWKEAVHQSAYTLDEEQFNQLIEKTE